MYKVFPKRRLSLQIRRHQHLEIDFRSLSASQQGHPNAAQTDMHGNQGMLWLLLTAHYPRDTSLSGLFSHTVSMHLAAVVVTKTKTPEAACQSNAKSPSIRPPEIICRINPQIRYKTLLPLIMRDIIADNPRRGLEWTTSRRTTHAGLFLFPAGRLSRQFRSIIQGFDCTKNNKRLARVGLTTVLVLQTGIFNHIPLRAVWPSGL